MTCSTVRPHARHAAAWLAAGVSALALAACSPPAAKKAETPAAAPRPPLRPTSS